MHGNSNQWQHDGFFVGYDFFTGPPLLLRYSSFSDFFSDQLLIWATYSVTSDSLLL